MTDECKHGSLRRSCEICERDEEIKRLSVKVAAFENAVYVGHPNPCTFGPLCPRCEIERLRAELAAHRKYLESITDNGSDYPETMDELIDLGLVVEAPPTQDFIDEWGDDCEMYVLAWSPLARRALDGEEVSDD